MYVCTYVCMETCRYVYLYVYIYIYEYLLHIYIYMHITHYDLFYHIVFGVAHLWCTALVFRVCSAKRGRWEVGFGVWFRTWSVERKDGGQALQNGGRQQGCFGGRAPKQP